MDSSELDCMWERRVIYRIYWIILWILDTKHAKNKPKKLYPTPRLNGWLSILQSEFTWKEKIKINFLWIGNKGSKLYELWVNFSFHLILGSSELNRKICIHRKLGGQTPKLFKMLQISVKIKEIFSKISGWSKQSTNSFRIYYKLNNIF